ncbi:Tetratricopeptide repeat protein 33 [Armadillidium vulgare]|nr:Tetratricopeptide repeat protein 33 [Armadillidium vulgare]
MGQSRKALLLEDKISKAKRLRDEGVILADEERWWEAINHWAEAVSLIPNDHETLDMIAQAYMKVGEIFPAVKSATLATDVAPLWWPGYQTLGRSQLGVGEVSLAIKSFSKAIRLSPDQMELWKEDLEWAINLREKQNELEESDKQRKLEVERENALIIEELENEQQESEFMKSCDDKSENKKPDKISQGLPNDKEYNFKYNSKVPLVRFKR